MLGITHLAAGAAIGAVFERRKTAAAAAVISHAVLDCIPHDDDTVGVAGQALLGLLGLGALALACGPTAPATTAGIAGAAPDAEVVLFMLRDRRGFMLFPSHWQLRHRRGEHPWQVRGPQVPIATELLLSVTVLTVLCRRQRRRRVGRGSAR